MCGAPVDRPGQAGAAQLLRRLLSLAAERQLRSVAFCCVSTGEFHFPNREAAGIAVTAAREFLCRNGGIQVIFNVFKDTDLRIYQELLGTD